MTTYTVATPAVKEYQILTSIVDRKMREHDTLDSIRFWLNRYNVQGAEIAERYGMTVIELVDAWVAWCEVIDAERKAQAS